VELESLNNGTESISSAGVDRCRSWKSFSGARFTVFTILFLIMLPGSLALFILLSDYSYGIQFASVVAYSAAIGLYTFARNKAAPAFLFECPIVQSQLPRLYRRHAAFLTTLFVFQTLAFGLKPHLPGSWVTASGNNMPPFVGALMIFAVVLAVIQILTNRSLLEKAHLESSGEQPVQLGGTEL
jgi:hypothetical protein